MWKKIETAFFFFPVIDLSFFWFLFPDVKENVREHIFTCGKKKLYFLGVFFFFFLRHVAHERSNGVFRFLLKRNWRKGNLFFFFWKVVSIPSIQPIFFCLFVGPSWFLWLCDCVFFSAHLEHPMLQKRVFFDFERRKYLETK